MADEDELFHGTFEVTDDPAGTSTELPVVVLGEAGSGRGPGPRLLFGRVDERRVLYPAYGLVFIAGALAVTFAMEHPEWAVGPVGLAWFVLFGWIWFYGVAYRYRRRLLKYTSVTVVLGLSWLLIGFCIDRARAQIAMGGPVQDMVVQGSPLIERAYAPELVWAGGITAIAAALVVVHVVFLGRGYREKKVRRRGAPTTV